MEIIVLSIQYCRLSKRKMEKKKKSKKCTGIGKLKKEKKKYTDSKTLQVDGLYHFIFQPEFQWFPGKW